MLGLGFICRMLVGRSVVAAAAGRSKELTCAYDHRSIASMAVYTALAPNRFKDFWRE